MSKYLLPFIVILVTNIAFAGGNGSGGGDAECERRAKDIRDDIAKWIDNDGPGKRKLDLSGTKFTRPEYAKQMLTWLQEGNVIFSCVNPLTLNQYPADVRASKTLLAQRLNMSGSDKKCEWEMIDNNTRASVVCDSNYIRPVDYSNAQDRVLNRAQYVQIHHEFAGPAGIERPLNPSHPEDSNYSVSKQFEFFVGPELIESLQVNPPGDGVTQTSPDLLSLPFGTKVRFPVNKLIPAYQFYGQEIWLDKMSLGNGDYHICKFNVAQSNSDRMLSGWLEIDFNSSHPSLINGRFQADSPGPDYILVDRDPLDAVLTNDIPTLNGAPIKDILRIECGTYSDGQRLADWHEESWSIADFKKYIESLGGTMQLPPPKSFR